ncbi:MAG: hypothetical protein K2X43_07895, partial [Hyphomonadaceae bacterium]|nr:hypothetical protein [Hyphomonadaceae bacterium]
HELARVLSIAKFVQRLLQDPANFAIATLAACPMPRPPRPSRRLSPGSISRLAPALVEGWLPGTSPAYGGIDAAEARLIEPVEPVTLP